MLNLEHKTVQTRSKNHLVNLYTGVTEYLYLCCCISSNLLLYLYFAQVWPPWLHCPHGPWAEMVPRICLHSSQAPLLSTLSTLCSLSSSSSSPCPAAPPLSWLGNDKWSDPKTFRVSKAQTATMSPKPLFFASPADIVLFPQNGGFQTFHFKESFKDEQPELLLTSIL